MASKSCDECGSEELLVIHDKRRLCKNCHAEAHGQALSFSHPTLEIIEEIRAQGKSYEFIAKHLGISRPRVYQIRNGSNGS